MTPDFLASLEKMDLPEEVKATLRAVHPKTLPHREELVKWLALPRTFTAKVYYAAAKSLGVEAPPFEAFVDLPEVERVIGYPGRYQIAASMRSRVVPTARSDEKLEQWGMDCAYSLDPYDDVELLDRLQLLVLCDPWGGVVELEEAFESADDQGDIPRCGALVQAIAAVLSYAAPDADVQSLFRQLQARYRARALFYTEFLQGAGYFPRPDTQRTLNRFVESQGGREWIFHLYATGGMGKTTLLRRMLSANWVVGEQRHACAWIDLDYLEVQSVLTAPVLLAMVIAAQWNEQIEDRVFTSMLTSTLQPLGALLFRDPGDRAATGLANARVDSIAQTQYRAGRSNPMRCGILAGAVPPASADRRRELENTAKGFRYVWNEWFPAAIARMPAGRPPVIVIDTIEEASLQYSAELGETLRLLRELRNKVNPNAPLEVKLILSGRYELGKNGHVPQFPQDFAGQYLSWALPGFQETEAEAFLKARLKPGQNKLVPAMISKSEGTPFQLSLFAEWARDDENLSEATIRQSEAISTVMLIERIVKRIPYQPLRWVIRYGCVPRKLTRAFLADVMRQPLIDALNGKASRDGADKTVSGVERDVWQQEPNFTFDAGKLWDEHVRRYASERGWLEPDADGVRFRPDVRNPMRMLLRRQTVFRELHGAAASWYRGQRGTLVEWFYHRLQLRGIPDEPVEDLLPALRKLLDGAAMMANATLRRDTAATLTSEDFSAWHPEERVYLEYRKAEGVAAANGYHYFTDPNSGTAIRKVFETVGTEHTGVLPPFAFEWKQAADRVPVSVLSSHLDSLPDEDVRQLGLLVADVAGVVSPITGEALRKALTRRGTIVGEGWLLERLAEHLRPRNPAEAIDQYQLAARAFEASGDGEKAQSLSATAARIAISSGRLALAVRILEPLSAGSSDSLAVSLELARVEVAKGQPEAALRILDGLRSQALNDAGRFEASTLWAEALSQCLRWSEAGLEWEAALKTASDQSDQVGAAQCVAGLVKLHAWWMRRTDQTALETLSRRARSLSGNLPSAELQVWQIALGDEQARRLAITQLGERTTNQRTRLLLTLCRLPDAERRWGDLLAAVRQLPSAARIVVLMEPVLDGERPQGLMETTRRELEVALRYQPEDAVEAEWYAIRHGELLAWLGFPAEAVELLARSVPVPRQDAAPWQAATYRERRRVEQRIRDWGGVVDPAPDDPEFWSRIWSDTPVRLAAVLVENARRALDARNPNLARTCLAMAQPALNGISFETEFHRSMLAVRSELDRQPRGVPRVTEPASGTASIQRLDVLSLQVVGDGLVASWEQTDRRRLYSDSEVQEFLVRGRGLQRGLAGINPDELVHGLGDILQAAIGSQRSELSLIGLQTPFGPLTSAPWELSARERVQLYRVPSGTGGYQPDVEVRPSPRATRANSILLFPLSPQVKDSPAFGAYLAMARQIPAGETLDDLGRMNQPPGLVYLACCFEELGTLGETSIAGLTASAATFSSYLAKFGQGVTPAVVLDVPAPYSRTEMIQQSVLRNSFAQAVLDSGAVHCVLATGLRPADGAMQVFERVLHELDAGATPQVDLLRDIGGIRTGPPYGDALFTRNPLRSLAGAAPQPPAGGALSA